MALGAPTAAANRRAMRGSAQFLHHAVSDLGAPSPQLSRGVWLTAPSASRLERGKKLSRAEKRLTLPTRRVAARELGPDRPRLLFGGFLGAQRACCWSSVGLFLA